MPAVEKVVLIFCANILALVLGFMPGVTDIWSDDRRGFLSDGGKGDLVK